MESLLEHVIASCNKGSLDEAILIAVTAHQGQVDRGGHPYILHPLAVMRRVCNVGERAAIVGVLHDVVEDSDYVTYTHLVGCGFDGEVIQALKNLEHPKGMTILQAAEKIAALDIRKESTILTMHVKIADYTENSDLRRIPEPTEEDTARRLRYLEALQIVSKAFAKVQ